MDPDLKNMLEEQQKQLAAIYKSVEKTRKYFQWTLIATVAFFVLPLIGLIAVIPTFLSIYSTALNF